MGESGESGVRRCGVVCNIRRPPAMLQVETDFGALLGAIGTIRGLIQACKGLLAVYLIPASFTRPYI
jgi:hypothetical protein